MVRAFEPPASQRRHAAARVPVGVGQQDGIDAGERGRLVREVTRRIDQQPDTGVDQKRALPAP
jgi:hypothetical protein